MNLETVHMILMLRSLKFKADQGNAPENHWKGAFKRIDQYEIENVSLQAPN